jgi:hypothetical protein
MTASEKKERGFDIIARCQMHKSALKQADEMLTADRHAVREELKQYDKIIENVSREDPAQDLMFPLEEPTPPQSLERMMGYWTVLEWKKAGSFIKVDVARLMPNLFAAHVVAYVTIDKEREHEVIHTLWNGGNTKAAACDAIAKYLVEALEVKVKNVRKRLAENEAKKVEGILNRVKEWRQTEEALERQKAEREAREKEEQKKAAQQKEGGDPGVPTPADPEKVWEPEDFTRDGKPATVADVQEVYVSGRLRHILNDGSRAARTDPTCWTLAPRPTSPGPIPSRSWSPPRPSRRSSRDSPPTCAAGSWTGAGGGAVKSSSTAPARSRSPWPSAPAPCPASTSAPPTPGRSRPTSRSPGSSRPTVLSLARGYPVENPYTTWREAVAKTVFCRQAPLLNGANLSRARELTTVDRQVVYGISPCYPHARG